VDFGVTGRGLLIRGTGAWGGYEVMIFYVERLNCRSAAAGQLVAEPRTSGTRK
jgi:hypothetical protein